MTVDRSIKAFEFYAQARDKFDYFVVGAAGALCAYVAQNLKVGELGATPGTLELAALLVLIGSVVAGFRRMELAVQLLAFNHLTLHHSEIAGELAKGAQQYQRMISDSGEVLGSAEAMQRAVTHSNLAKKVQEQSSGARIPAERWYKWRNRLLLIGFLMLVASRVWAPYYVT